MWEAEVWRSQRLAGRTADSAEPKAALVLYSGIQKRPPDSPGPAEHVQGDTVTRAAQALILHHAVQSHERKDKNVIDRM